MEEDQRHSHHYVLLFENLFQSSTKVIKYVFWILLCMLICFQICVHIPQLRTHVSFVYNHDGVPMVEQDVKDW